MVFTKRLTKRLTRGFTGRIWVLSGLLLALIAPVLLCAPAFAVNEICTYDVTGKTLYAMEVSSTAQAWNGTAFESIINADWPAYGTVMTEKGTTGLYVCSFPTGITGVGRYRTFIFEEATAGTIAVGDKLIASGAIDWSGTAQVTLAAVSATDTATSATATSTNTRVQLALPAIAPGANGGLPTGNASGQVTLTSAEHTNNQADAYRALNQAAPSVPTTGSLFDTEAQDLATTQAILTINQNLVTGTGTSTRFTTTALSNGNAGITDASITTDVMTALNTSAPLSPTSGSLFAQIASTMTSITGLPVAFWTYTGGSGRTLTGGSDPLASLLTNYIVPGTAGYALSATLAQTTAAQQQANGQAALAAQGFTSAAVAQMLSQIAKTYGAEWGNVSKNSDGSYSVTMPGTTVTVPASGAALGMTHPIYSGQILQSTTKSVN